MSALDPRLLGIGKIGQPCKDSEGRDGIWVQPKFSCPSPITVNGQLIDVACPQVMPMPRCDVRNIEVVADQSRQLKKRLRAINKLPREKRRAARLKFQRDVKAQTRARSKRERERIKALRAKRKRPLTARRRR